LVSIGGCGTQSGDLSIEGSNPSQGLLSARTKEAGLSRLKTHRVSKL
jgi:hypothetical protein